MCANTRFCPVSNHNRFKGEVGIIFYPFYLALLFYLVLNSLYEMLTDTIIALQKACPLEGKKSVNYSSFKLEECKIWQFCAD